MQNSRITGSVAAALDAAPRDATANLLLAATRRFCDARPPSYTECDQYREAFYACVHRLDTATRQSVATLLSRTPSCPRPIALFLAMDVPAVSHAILKHSAVLGDRDLEQIITKTTPIHVRLLATRPHLSEQIIERIAAFDDADIHAALVANATLSLDTELRERLSPRAEGPLRRTVKASKTAAPIASVESRLRTALARTAPGRAQLAAEPAPASVMDSATFREAFEACAMRRDRRGMVEAMRTRFSLAHATAVQALDDRTGDALQVMMKAEGFDAATANRIVMLAVPAVGLSPAATQRALEIWQRLKVETCRSAFAAWPRAESAKPVSHHPVHDDAEGVRRDEMRPAARGERSESFRRTG